MIGIYKITSPTGRVYIGQSVNISKRFKSYIKLNCKRQIRLYNSFKKHSVDSHKFEIIEECKVEQLNERERYWQECYDVLSRNGLNCHLTSTKDKKLIHIDFIINKLKSLNGEKHHNYGRKHSKEINDSKGRKGNLNYWFGKKADPKSTRIRQLKRSNKVKIIENGNETIFDCVSDCAKYLKCTTKNILYRNKCRIENRQSIGKYKDIYIEILK